MHTLTSYTSLLFCCAWEVKLTLSDILIIIVAYLFIPYEALSFISRLQLKRIFKLNEILSLAWSLRVL